MLAPIVAVRILPRHLLDARHFRREVLVAAFTFTFIQIDNKVVEGPVAEKLFALLAELRGGDLMV